MRVDTHVRQNLAKQKEGKRKIVKILLTQVLVCARYRWCLISCVTFLNFESKYLEGTVSPDFLPIFFLLLSIPSGALINRLKYFRFLN